MSSAWAPQLSMAALHVVLGQFCKARRLFSDGCFEWTRLYDDNDPVCVLKKPPLGDRGSELLYNLVEFGVAECLDRQCIRSITFFFMDATNGRVVEELTMDCDPFHGEYPSTTPSEALRQLTRKHRLLVQTLKPLPVKTTFAVRLTLIGSAMPYPSWVPPFFPTAALRSNAKHPRLHRQSVSLQIGEFDSARQMCTLSIRSSQDLLEELSTSSPAGNVSDNDVAFDPEFTQISPIGRNTQHDLSLYQTIKTFVVACAVPSMQRTHDAYKTVTMPTIRTYFNQLCEEGVLERRGRRFYSVGHAASDASRTSVGAKRTLASDTRRNSTVRETRFSAQQKFSHPHGGIAKLYQSHRQCWFPRAPIVSLSSDKAQASVSKYPGGPRAKYQPRSSSSGIKVLFAASNPITQLKEQWQSRRSWSASSNLLGLHCSGEQQYNKDRLIGGRGTWLHLSFRFLTFQLHQLNDKNFWNGVYTPNNHLGGPHNLGCHVPAQTHEGINPGITAAKRDVSGRIREAIETRRTPMVVTEKATSANGSATLDKTVKAPEAEKPDTVYGPVEDECFGKRIRKSFGSRAFWGTIVASYVVGNGVFYKVSFDDGDVDILSAGEVYHDLSAAKRHADEDASQKEPEAERVLTGGVSPSSPTRLTYADALRSRKSSLKRRRDSSDSETQDEVSAGSPWNVKLWSSRLFATIMEEDGFIRVQDFVTMPNGEPGEMESTGKVRPGDAMLAVQGRIVHGVMDHMQACDLIRTLPRPLTLTFIRPPENEDMAIVDAAVEKIQAAASESQDAQSTSKKPRVDPLPSASSTSESLHPHSAPAPPSTSASGIPPRQPSPEVQIVGVSRPPSSATASHIQRHAPVPVQHPRPAFSGPPSSLPANVSTFVPSGPRGPTIFQSHVSRLGRYHPQHQNRSRTPSPGPPSAGYAENSGPRPHQPSHQETTQMSGSSLVATVRIPAHFASSTSAPFPSSSHQVVSQSGLAFTVPHPGPQAYQRPEQATLNESRSGVHSNQNVVHLGTQSFGQYGQHPAVTSSAPPFNQLVNHQRGSGNLPIQASGSASVAGLSHAPPTHGNTTTAQEVRYTYSRQMHGSMPPSGSSLGHISTGPIPPTHAVSTNSFQRVASRQESSEDDRARNMTLGDYMVYTAQRERLALRNNAASQRTHQALHSTRQPQPQHTVPSSTPTQHQAEPRTVQPPIVGVPAVRQERSTPDEATQGASFETFDDVLAQVVSGAAGSTGSSFLSLKETSYLADIPIKQRASRMNRITGRSDASLSARATSYAPPRPHYLSKYDADEVVEVTISKQRLYVTLGHMGQNISISSFVRGGDGEVGEIEASGKVLTGDILVGVGSVQIPAFISPGEVARIVNTQPRPCTAYFIRATWEMLE